MGFDSYPTENEQVYCLSQKAFKKKLSIHKTLILGQTTLTKIFSFTVDRIIKLPLSIPY